VSTASSSLPDEYLAQSTSPQTDVEIIIWEGACEVHERFTGEEIRGYRADTKDLVVIAHPSARPTSLAEADYVGSTAGMIRYVQERSPRRSR
jgi:quinolinate synthase